MDEQMLPPTAFIQSTHNTVAAQVALMLKCHNYNNTFVHKGISFESALLDAIMLLNEGEASDVLVGGVEELTDASYKVLSRLGLFKRWPLSNFDLFKTPTNGTIGGEGAAFFLLTEEESPNNLARFDGVQTYYGLNGTDAIEEKIISFLKQYDLTIADIDLVITGKNGDVKNDIIYQQLNDSLFNNTSLANYKHLCGEYAVSTSFALWLAANILKRQEIPEIVVEKISQKTSTQKILIFNHYLNTYHSLMLVSAC
jgi:3-oxoacyl-[acyl-carrier-protein] synthase II